MLKVLLNQKNINIFILVLLSFYMQPAIAVVNRIVGIGPEVNSILEALHVQNLVVGADNQSMSLYANQTVSDMGYMRALSTETIVAVRPQICISVAEAAPQKVFDDLARFNIQAVRLKPLKSANTVYDNILLIGNAIGKPQSARYLRDTMEHQVKDALARTPQHNHIKALVLLQLAPNSMFLMGKNTHSDLWLNLIHVKNILNFSGMRPVSREGLLALKPDIVLVAKANLAQATAFQNELNILSKQNNSRTIIINSTMLEGFGADFANNLNLMIEKIYYAG